MGLSAQPAKLNQPRFGFSEANLKKRLWPSFCGVSRWFSFAISFAMALDASSVGSEPGAVGVDGEAISRGVEELAENPIPTRCRTLSAVVRNWRLPQVLESGLGASGKFIICQLSSFICH